MELPILVPTPQVINNTAEKAIVNQVDIGDKTSSIDTLPQSSNIQDIDHKLTKEEAMELRQTESEYKEALAYIKDMIAPAMMRIDATKLQI